MSLTTNSKWDKLLTAQTILFFIAVSFSIGSADTTEEQSGGGWFIIFKILAYGIICYSGIYLLSRSNEAYKEFKKTLGSHFYVFVYLALAIIFLPFAVDIKHSFFKFVVFAYSYFALLMLVAQHSAIYKQDARTMLFKNTLVFFALLILFPIAATILNGPAGFLGAFRAKIGCGIVHPNHLSALYTYGFFFGLFYRYIQAPRQFSKFELRATKMISFVFPLLIVLAFSRGALVAIILAVTISIVILTIKYGIKKLAILQLAGLVAFTGFALLISTGVIPIQSLISSFSRLESGADLYTLTGRTELWEFVLKQIDIQSLITGNGYARMSGGGEFAISHGKLFGAHNTYLMVLASMGIFGLLALLLFLHQCLSRTFLAMKVLPAPAVAYFLIILFVFMFHSVVDSFFGLNLGGVFSILLISFTYPLINIKNEKSITNNL